MNDLEQIEAMIDLLKRCKREVKKREKLSDKVAQMDIRVQSARQMERASTDLNWQCMEADKAAIDFARAFKGSCLDVSTGKHYFNPSPFHEYEY